jgi:Methyltransferase domain
LKQLLKMGWGKLYGHTTVRSVFVRAEQILERARSWIGWALMTTKPFRLLLWFGVQVTPVHYYSPVPDVRDLRRRPEIWEHPSDLPGIDMRVDAQQALMTEVFVRYHEECDFPRRATNRSSEYHTDNVYFGYVSAVAMHSMIRHFKPRRVIEIGAGFSTLVIGGAARLNASEGWRTEVTAIDPYPSEIVAGGIPGVDHLIADRVERLGTEAFKELARHDIVSIDSSHTVKTGGEVPYLYLDVLPRLPAGVFVHIHDIFLPDEYPQAWLFRRHYWNEQYLVHAFLIGNRHFEVVWAPRFMELTFPNDYRAMAMGRIGVEENNQSYSLWIRRTEDQ